MSNHDVLEKSALMTQAERRLLGVYKDRKATPGKESIELKTIMWLAGVSPFSYEVLLEALASVEEKGWVRHGLGDAFLLTEAGYEEMLKL